MFINRKKELTELKKHFASDKFEFIVIFGRRRVGKTSLVLESLKDIEKTIYFQATEQDEKINLRKFREELMFSYPEVGMLNNTWDEIINFLSNKVNVIVLDEFSFIIGSNQKLKKSLANTIENNLTNQNFKLVVIGSSISTIEDKIISEKSPLSDKITFSKKLDPLNIREIKEFLPKYDAHQIFMTYATLGCVPYFLEQFNPNCDFWTNVEGAILSPNALLRYEATNLVREEFYNITMYNSILQAIAIGRRTPAEIRTYLSSDSDISSYLSRLIQMDMISRKVPFGEDPSKSRNSRYQIKDLYLRFWYTFISYNATLLSNSNQEQVLKLIKSRFDQFLAFTYIELVKDLFVNFPILEFQVDKLGSWWNKERELDLIGEIKGGFVFFRVTWRDMDSELVSEELKKIKLKDIPFKGKNHYVLVVRDFNGWRRPGLSENESLFTLNDIFDKIDE